ncbi:hypothetical protein Tco_1088514, partial [Tanacetum coccineum]
LPSEISTISLFVNVAAQELSAAKYIWLMLLVISAAR